MASHADSDPLIYGALGYGVLDAKQRDYLLAQGESVDPSQVSNPMLGPGLTRLAAGGALAFTGAGISAQFAEAPHAHATNAGDRIVAVGNYTPPTAYDGADAVAAKAASAATAHLEATMHGQGDHMEKHRVTPGFTFSQYEFDHDLPPGSVTNMNRHLDPRKLQIDSYVNVPDAASRAILAEFNNTYQHQGIGVSGDRLRFDNLPKRDAGILIRNADGSDTQAHVKVIGFDKQTGAYTIKTWGGQKIPMDSVIAYTESPVTKNVSLPNIPHHSYYQAHAEQQAKDGASPTHTQKAGSPGLPAADGSAYNHTRLGRDPVPRLQSHPASANRSNDEAQPADNQAPEPSGSQSAQHGTITSTSPPTDSADIPGISASSPNTAPNPDNQPAKSHKSLAITHPHSSIDNALSSLAAIPGTSTNPELQATGLGPESGSPNNSATNHSANTRTAELQSAAQDERKVRAAIVRSALHQYRLYGGQDYYGNTGIQQFTGQASYEQWCADENSLIMQAAGHPYTDGRPSNPADIIRVANVSGSPHINYDTLQEWYQQNGTFWWNTGHGRMPEPGDVFFMGTSPNEITHTGTIVAVDGNTITTIEGDSLDASGNYVLGKGTYNITDPANDIIAFGSLFGKHPAAHQPQTAARTHSHTPNKQGKQPSVVPQIPGIAEISYTNNPPKNGSAIPGVGHLIKIAGTQGNSQHGSSGSSHPEQHGNNQNSVIGGRFSNGEWQSSYQHPHTVETFVANTLSMLAAVKHVPESQVMTKANFQVMTAWVLSEGGNIANQYHNNLLNTGFLDMNLIDGPPASDGTQSYKTMIDGVEATVQTITAPQQNRIEHALLNPKLTDQQKLYAIAHPGSNNSCWACAPTTPQEYFGSLMRSLQKVKANYANIASIVIGRGQEGQNHAPFNQLKFARMVMSSSVSPSQNSASRTGQSTSRPAASPAHSRNPVTKSGQPAIPGAPLSSGQANPF